VKNVAQGTGSYAWTGLDGNTQYFYKIFPYTNSGVQINYKTGGTPPEDNATTFKVEPTNHPTGFGATADSDSQITTGWTDSTGGQVPDGYLVLCNKTGTFSDPADGTPQVDDTACADGSGVKNVAQGTGSYAWTGLDSITQYYYKIFPYTNSGVQINYKTDGTPLTDNATTQATQCTASSGGNWSNAATWSCGKVPEAGDNVTIPAGFTVTLDASADPTPVLGDLTIQGTLIVPGSQTLKVSGDIAITGTFTPGTGTVELTGGGNQTISGTPPVTFYRLTINKDVKTETVTAANKIKVTKKLTLTKGKLISASDYEDIEIAADGELELTSSITVGGEFSISGLLTTNGNGVTFDGAKQQNLAANVVTSFDDLTVSSGTTLIETVSDDNVALGGSLTNNGVIRKTQAVNSTTQYYFGLAGKFNGGDMEINVTSLAGNNPLTAIQVDQVAGNHPGRTGSDGHGVGWGHYWVITPTGSDFTADVMLPHDLTTPSDAYACRYSGSGIIWDCKHELPVGSTTVTYPDTTAFSDWAVGERVGPLAVQVREYSATHGSSAVLPWLALAGALLVGLAAWVMRRAHR
jgi:hypothetical protein